MPGQKREVVSSLLHVHVMLKMEGTRNKMRKKQQDCMGGYIYVNA